MWRQEDEQEVAEEVSQVEEEEVKAEPGEEVKFEAGVKGTEVAGQERRELDRRVARPEEAGTLCLLVTSYRVRKV